MRLIIFGINEYTREIIDSINSPNEITAISDSFLDKKEIYGFHYVRIDEISRTNFDYIIVCVKKRKTYEDVKKKLCNLGIPSEKILSFMNLYYESRVDQVMLQAKLLRRSFDGLVIGISHAAYAINPLLLDGNWANIAVPSEDLINHNYVLDKLINNYYDQIKGIKRVIVDLYDYSVLNFITSQSRYSVEFYDLYCGDGIELQESFERLENEILKRGNYSSSYARKNRSIRRELFDEKTVFSKFHNRVFFPETPIDFFFKECVCCENVIDSAELSKDFIPRIQHDDNISINKKELFDLIDKFYYINPNVKVIFVLIPRIAEIENELNPKLLEYQKILFDTIDLIRKRNRNISLLDYKGSNQISLYKEGYCSVAHMNTYGQKRFTELLNKDIQRGV